MPNRFSTTPVLDKSIRLIHSSKTFERNMNMLTTAVILYRNMKIWRYCENKKKTNSKNSEEATCPASFSISCFTLLLVFYPYPCWNNHRWEMLMNIIYCASNWWEKGRDMSHLLTTFFIIWSEFFGIPKNTSLYGPNFSFDIYTETFKYSNTF